MPPRPPKDVLTTREAARLLGLSVSSVQRLVMDQSLEAWLTPGGHRRISRRAVERLKGHSPTAPVARALPPEGLKVLLVDDDEMQRAYLQACLSDARAPLALSWANDASQALIQIERHRPDLVITDLLMSPFDGFHLVNALATEPEYADIAVLVVTGLQAAEAHQHGQLPAWATVYAKPVAPLRIAGYVDALHSRLLRAAHHAPLRASGRGDCP